jgi:hypothetical protein
MVARQRRIAFVFDAIVGTTATLFQFRTLTFPVTSFLAVIAQSGLDTTGRKAILHEGHNQNVGQVGSGERRRRGAGILSVLGRRPFGRVFQTTIDSLHGFANVGVQEPSVIHMGLGGALFFQSDLLKSNLEALMKGTKGKAKGFVPITPTLEEDLKHLEGQGVIVVTSHRQDLCINAKVFDELYHVLTRVLRRVSALDLAFQFLKTVDRRRHHKRNELKPDDREGGLIRNTIADPLLEVGVHGVKKALNGSLVVVSIDGVVLLHLNCS